MSIYYQYLPHAFPYSMTVKAERAPEVASVLMRGDEIAPEGSSFAVTMDTTLENTKVFWLSKISHDRIGEQGYTWIKEVLA